METIEDAKARHPDSMISRMFDCKPSYVMEELSFDSQLHKYGGKMNGYPVVVTMGWYPNGVGWSPCIEVTYDMKENWCAGDRSRSVSCTKNEYTHSTFADYKWGVSRLKRMVKEQKKRYLIRSIS